jgi:hypothetical protein
MERPHLSQAVICLCQSERFLLIKNLKNPAKWNCSLQDFDDIQYIAPFGGFFASVLANCGCSRVAALR